MNGFKDERSIGISIIVNDENFFRNPKYGARSLSLNQFWRDWILLKEVVKKIKLDTNIELLKSM
jgi:hypothetical protein